MYESIKSACKVLDRFGLPRAIGSLVTDRFIVANKSFLRVIGLGRDEISSLALSEIVTIDLDSYEKRPSGRLLTIKVRAFGEDPTVAGQAALADQNLVFLMIPTAIEPSPEFELGAAFGEEAYRQKLDLTFMRIGARIYDRRLFIRLDPNSIGEGKPSVCSGIQSH